ncbi:C39 family peptidase [Olsenella uli]|uniref:C39 family peptidase n=1 Tax=Olsenella uli TaxID=133926 RepID=UPI001EF73486|nr:C39 family peptidase [Olsenella uli]
MTRMRIAPSRYVKIRRARRTPLLALLAVAAVGLIALAASALFAASSPAAAAEPATSTPRSEWHAGEVPYLYQTDPAWSQEPYAGGTVEKNGCGPTCLSMAYVALTGRTDLDPAQMAAFAERGGYVQDGMSTWTLMSEGAEQLGLSSEELPADADVVRAALSAGKVVICSVRPGDFTSAGHFIVLAGLTEDGEVEVRDPNSAARSHAWDPDRVLGQCANLWALSA